MKRTKLYGVALSKTYQKRETLSALTWLNLKIDDFISDCGDARYMVSQKATMDYSEIMGVLKYLHISGIITAEESRAIKNNIAKQYRPKSTREEAQ